MNTFVLVRRYGRNKFLAQSMEALRADDRVGFIRLSRTEAGIYPPPKMAMRETT